ncbi:uncharacterized protein [Procambarus clarkii]|uniref:uncharacterized protein n=1 Tax=Procambarus clarkii TaxID=6728 RepID=UPI003742A563
MGRDPFQEGHPHPSHLITHHSPLAPGTSLASSPAIQLPFYQKATAYNYVVRDDYTGAHFGHAEARDGYLGHGEYFVHLPDGRVQTVTYHTDETGYHPIVTYEGEAYHPPTFTTHHKLSPDTDKLSHDSQLANSASLLVYHAKPTYSRANLKSPDFISIHNALKSEYGDLKLPSHNPKPIYHTSKPIYNDPKPSSHTPIYSPKTFNFYAMKPTFLAPKLTNQARKSIYPSIKPSHHTLQPTIYAPEPSYLALKATIYAPEPIYKDSRTSYHTPEPAEPIDHIPTLAFDFSEPLFRSSVESRIKVV